MNASSSIVTGTKTLYIEDTFANLVTNNGIANIKLAYSLIDVNVFLSNASAGIL